MHVVPYLSTVTFCKVGLFSQVAGEWLLVLRRPDSAGKKGKIGEVFGGVRML
jgi:hypothetical protein